MLHAWNFIKCKTEEINVIFFRHCLTVYRSVYVFYFYVHNAKIFIVYIVAKIVVQNWWCSGSYFIRVTISQFLFACKYLCVHTAQIYFLFRCIWGLKLRGLYTHAEFGDNIHKMHLWCAVVVVRQGTYTRAKFICRFFMWNIFSLHWKRICMWLFLSFDVCICVCAETIYYAREYN